MKHQMTFDTRKDAQLCLVQAGGWISFHHQKPVFVFSTAEDKQTYMTLLAEKVAEVTKEESRRHETMEENHDNPQMFAQSE
ncbi:hypothetical protein M3579_11410 [Bacillus pumilus]|uniref:hypothetical protein n=1 Tax=Bacillus pumilus TaxID=1408 RepID=UPI0020423C95|nr:hypothetical protein [Bacillus pumilus]MCM3036567.1 hypothetical protein [Bacillus pumilus]